MPAPAAQCRAFTHPVRLLIRSSAQPTARPSSCLAARCAPQCVSSPASLSSARLFTTARALRSQARPKPSSKQPAAKPSGGSKAAPTTRPAPATSSSSSSSSSDSYIERLAKNPQGTVLYEAGPQRVFLLSSYAAGLSCMLGAALDVHYNVFNVPPGVPQWTAYAFGSVGLMMAILGTSFALKPSNVVRQIRVLPAAPGSRKVQLEVVSRRLAPLPGLPYRREVVEPRDVVLRTRAFAPRPSAAAARAEEREWARRRQAQARYDEEHRMTIPFRDAKAAAETVFTSLRRGLTGEGFAAIDVRGQRYKLDIQNGYVYEGGRALDRIVRFEPEESRMNLMFRK